MPGDYDIEYCSPWAGANYQPYAAPLSARKSGTNMPSVGVLGSNHARWEQETWPALKDLAENHLDAGVHFQGIPRPSLLDNSV